MLPQALITCYRDGHGAGVMGLRGEMEGRGEGGREGEGGKKRRGRYGWVSFLCKCEKHSQSKLITMLKFRSLYCGPDHADQMDRSISQTLVSILCSKL